MRKIVLFLSMFFVMIACENNNLQENEKTLYVASKKVDCMGLFAQQCLMVKENNQQNWEYFYDSIVGFTYQEGFEYEILVSEKRIENPPQDASSIETTLIKIISKTEKI